MEKLRQIQAELKAPKNQRNNFGKYNYRSCELYRMAMMKFIQWRKRELTQTVKEWILPNLLEAVAVIRGNMR